MNDKDTKIFPGKTNPMPTPSLFETEEPLPPNVVAYTDGSCLQNPGGHSGAAAILHPSDGPKIHISQGFRSSTNQRQELYGLLLALEALEAVGPSTRLLVRSDSLYAVQGFRNHQHAPANRLPTANRDLWIRIRNASRFLESVETEWIKGHSGNPGNEEADQLAGEAAQFGPWIEDPGYTHPKTCHIAK